MNLLQKYKLDSLILPAVAVGAVMILWFILAGKSTTTSGVDDFGDPVTTVKRVGISQDLPTPAETWAASKLYVTEPFAKRGEMDQGILRFTWLSLKLVLQGYVMALLIGAPLGFILGLSRSATKALDPLIEILRPVSPLAWFPLGLVLFSGLKLSDGGKVFFGPSDAAALFTIAVCSMWPTVVNTAVGVRKVPQDFLNVAKVLKLSRARTLFKVLVPATMPYMFTGFRLSLGIAWLVIVAVEMLTGRPGVGGFIWQAYNIGLVGFTLDRLMSVIERRFKTA
jgi:nitrate/nitrite transport system permease protein